MIATQDITYGVTGQSLILDCEDGPIASVTSVQVRYADADDTARGEDAGHGQPPQLAVHVRRGVSQVLQRVLGDAPSLLHAVAGDRVQRHAQRADARHDVGNGFERRGAGCIEHVDRAGLDADRSFLTKGGVFTDDQIDAYMELKWEEVYNWEHQPAPIEYKMYYSI